MSARDRDPWNAAAAEARVLAALRHLEDAQRELGLAAAELAPILGASRLWKRVLAARRRTHDEWRLVSEWSARRRGELRVDQVVADVQEGSKP